MSWELDTPNVPLKKSRQLEALETMSPDIRNAMDRVEMEERIEEAAYGLAKEYLKTPNSTYDVCTTIVNQALTETGAALGGKLGEIMVGTSGEVAESTCRVFFPEEENK